MFHPVNVKPVLVAVAESATVTVAPGTDCVTDGAVDVPELPSKVKVNGVELH